MAERSEAKSAKRSFTSKIKIRDILTRSFASRLYLCFVQPFLAKIKRTINWPLYRHELITFNKVIVASRKKKRFSWKSRPRLIKKNHVSAFLLALFDLLKRESHRLSKYLCSWAKTNREFFRQITLSGVFSRIIWKTLAQTDIFTKEHLRNETFVQRGTSNFTQTQVTFCASVLQPFKFFKPRNWLFRPLEQGSKYRSKSDCEAKRKRNFFREKTNRNLSENPK